MHKSKYFLSLVSVLLCVVMISAASVFSQVMDGVPHLINYQGRLTDSSGDPVTDGEYVVTFSIWSDSISTSSPDREWISPNCTLLVVNGLFNWQLGSRENLPPWTMSNNAELWLGILVESDPEIAPRTRLCSAPYSYKAWHADYAEYADSAGILVGGGSGGDITAVEAGWGLMGGGTEGDVTIDVEVGPGLSKGSDHIYLTPNGVHADRITDGTLTADDMAVGSLTGNEIQDGSVTASDIDNTTVQQRVADAAPPGSYITAINADGSVVTAVDENSGGDITGVEAGWGLMGGGTSGDVTIDVEVGPGLSKGSDHIYLTPNGVHADRITDGTLTADDIDNTSIQQRITGTAPAGYYITAINADGSVDTGADQTGIGESGEFDGDVQADMVETIPGAATTVVFDSPFTSTEKPHMYIAVVLKQSANGLVEGAAIKAVEDVKGGSGNWTSFDLTVSKYSDGSSITDGTDVYVTWMAIRR